MSITVAAFRLQLMDAQATPCRNRITKEIITEEPNVTYVEVRMATYRHGSTPMQVPCDLRPPT